jgi:membrane-anchored protein YejM (alkaline phosphatase superfamily)
MDPTAPATYRETLGHRLTEGAGYTLVNAAVSFVLGVPFLLRAVGEGGAPMVSAALMLASTAAALNLLVYVLLLAGAIGRLPRAAWVCLAAVCSTFLHVLLVVDFKLFSLFKFHVNGLVLNVLFTEGAGETTSLGGGTIAVLSAMAVLILAAEFALGWRLTAGRSARVRRVAWAPLALLLVFASDKVVYAWSDLSDRREVVAATRYFPFYVRVTVNRTAARLGLVARRRDRVNLDAGERSLRYPLRELAFAPEAKPRPVVMVVVEGLRADAVRPDVMPALTSFAAGAVRFDNHYASGNGTRFGVFGLLYGLNGNLWHAFLQARQPPAWVRPLVGRGYRFRVLSSAKLTFPEFRKTAFVSIPEGVRDQYPGDSLPERDRAVVADFVSEMRATGTNGPFFACLFLNSPHVTYHYPPEFERFRPVADEKVNYMREITPEQFEGLRNRYLNSLAFVDSLLDSIVGVLAEQGLGDAVVVVVGDHGQEFNETGFYGHNSAFNTYQLRTPLIVRAPGAAPRSVPALTSHVDVMPTILDLLGCVTPPAEYAHGRNLFTGEPRTHVYAVDWNESAVVMADYSLVVPAGPAALGALELRRSGDYRLATDAAATARGRAALVEIMRDTARFLR